jgi:hypothetical protein
MDAAYLRAAIPEPVRIFGVQLLPLSLGRYRLLNRFGCAFVAEVLVDAAMADLFLGILVCSMRCREFLEWIDTPASIRELKKWGKRIRKEIKADEHFNLFEKFALFKNYITEASQIPNYWEEQQSSGPGSGAHWSVAAEVVLRGELGYSADEIEEGSLRKALQDYFKWAENQGSIRLMTDEEVAQGEANAKLFASLAPSKP